MGSQAALFEERSGPSGEKITDINQELFATLGPRFPQRSFVFGMGNEKGDVIVIGESPGPQDLATGEPFTGPAGDLLKRILASIGLRYADCFLTNVVKFVSQGEELTPEIVALFTPFVRREVTAIAPGIVILLGATPTKALLDIKKPISQVRGEFHVVNGVTYLPTFNPAYLLRDPTKKKEVWDDMKKVRQYLSLGETSAH
jgi:uracil-DNA glycosylase family 4